MRLGLILALPHARCASALAVASVLAAAPAHAHGVAGNRFFPATISTDDPSVADELSLPTIFSFENGDDPSAAETDVAAEYSKRITARLGVSFAGAWTYLNTPGEPSASGFQNLETTVKYQFLTNAAHEAIVSGGVSAEWGGTGAARVGAESGTTVTPTLYFGKGAGDLPDSLSWARPFAVTGVVGYAVPATGNGSRVLRTGVAIEYSLAYLRAHVRDYGLPAFVNHLTPLVEASFDTPVTNTQGARTTGTINPGLIWSGRRFQIGAEAIVPINRDSGKAVGAVVQVHVYLDDLFARSIGKPIW